MNKYNNNTATHVLHALPHTVFFLSVFVCR